MCSERRRRRKKKRNEHCADVSREKKTFSMRQCHKKRILMLLYAEKKMREKKLVAPRW
jgi:hypothetical protein